MGLFVVTSIACTFVDSLSMLIVMRLLQAVGVSTGTVVSRAVIRDTHDAAVGARGMSYLTVGLGLAPVLAPMLGGRLYVAGGVRFVFTATAVAGCVVWLLPTGMLATLVFGLSIPVMTGLYGVTPMTVLPQMFLLMTLSGAVTPVVMAGAVYHHPVAAGTTAGLSSALGMVLGSSFTVWSGAVFTGDFAPIATIIGIASSLTFISWLMVRRAASADAIAAVRRAR